MIALTKGLLPGILLTWILCAIIGGNGSSGGMLHIFRGEVLDYQVYWSWSLFLASTGLAWFIFTLLE